MDATNSVVAEASSTIGPALSGAVTVAPATNTGNWLLASGRYTSTVPAAGWFWFEPDPAT